MIFAYLAAILVVSFCIVLFFVLRKKKQNEKLADYKQKKMEEEIKSYEFNTTEKEEIKETKAELEDFVIEKKEEKVEKKQEPVQMPIKQESAPVGDVDISDVDFDALENMDDDEFDETLKKFSPEKRDAVLDELLRRNED